MSTKFDAIGALVRAHAEREWEPDRRLALRARLVDAASTRSSRRRRSSWSVALIAMPLTLAAVLLVVHLFEPADLTVEVDGRPAARGLEIGVEAHQTLRFSDGSQVQLLRPGATRLAATTPRGATVELLEGRAEVAVTPRTNASWRFAAGPYVVHVVGTRFELDWDSARGRLELAMQEGAVRVTGPQLGEGKWLRDRARLEVVAPDRSASSVASPSPAAAEERLEPAVAAPKSGTDITSDTSEPVPSTPPPRSERSDARAPKPSAPASPRSPQSRAADPQRGAPHSAEPAGGGALAPEPSPTPISLAELARRGVYAQAIAEAERRGMQEVLDSGAASEVSAVADSARYTGHRELARRALLALRSRFPNTDPAASAAFRLGRLSEASDGALARHWYERYLQEAPDGPLAAEAYGRRMLLLHRLGGGAAAPDAAREYLVRYPGGAHAHHARSIVASQPPPLD